MSQNTGTMGTYQGALQAICVLHGVVTVIPRRSILSSLEDIVEAITRSDGTLRDAVDAIHIHGLVLSDSMPMNTGTILGHAIYHRYVQGLAIVSQAFNTANASLLTSPQQASSQGPG
jgi:hypothetical protein